MSKKLNTQTFIDKANKLHNYKYDYSETIYINSRTSVKIICKIHGAFAQRASSHLQGNGCPLCARKKSKSHIDNLTISARRSRGLTLLDFIKKAKLVHGDKYDYSKSVYTNRHSKILIICPKHGEFMQEAGSHLSGHGCKLCVVEQQPKYATKWDNLRRKKIEQTCMKKYGAKRYLDSDVGKSHIKHIKSSIEYRNKMSRIISSDEVQHKTINTNLAKYGKCSPMQVDKILEKQYKTKSENNSWNTSLPEKNVYDKLINTFGEDNVMIQYKSKLYPFRCDFYILSLDLYIEINITWLHGGSWFDATNETHMNKLKRWMLKANAGHLYYKTAIDVWLRRDLCKLNTAKTNNLNYLVFWESDLSDFDEWLNQYNNGNIILCNI